MSRTFVKEAENETADPARAISPHRNFVTEVGLAATESALRRLPFRILGEGEADPPGGTVSYVSPPLGPLTGRERLLRSPAGSRHTGRAVGNF